MPRPKKPKPPPQKTRDLRIPTTPEKLAQVLFKNDPKPRPKTKPKR